MDENKRKRLEQYLQNVSDMADNLPQYPSMYEIILKNSNSFNRDIYYYILATIFHKTDEQSEQAVQELEEEGLVLCGVYTKEVAETKILIATECAYENGGALKFSMRKGTHNVIKES